MIGLLQQSTEGSNPVRQALAWAIEGLDQMLVQNFGATRVAVAVLLFALLGYWTSERLLGQRDDPTLRMSSQGPTGSSSMLLSGTKAVGAVVGLIGLLLFPELQSNPGALILLGGVVAAHYYFEKEERES